MTTSNNEDEQAHAEALKWLDSLKESAPQRWSLTVGLVCDDGESWKLTIGLVRDGAWNTFSGIGKSVLDAILAVRAEMEEQE